MKNRYSYLDDYLKDGRVEESLAILKKPIQKGSPFACLYGLAIYSGSVDPNYRNENQFKRCYKLLKRINFGPRNLLDYYVKVYEKIYLDNPNDELLTFSFDTNNIKMMNIKFCVEAEIKHREKYEKERDREFNPEVRNKVNDYFIKAKELIANNNREECLKLLKESLVTIKDEDNIVIRKQWADLCIETYRLNKNKEELMELDKFYIELTKEAQKNFGGGIKTKGVKEGIEIELNFFKDIDLENASIKDIALHYRLAGIIQMSNKEKEEKGFNILTETFFKEDSDYAYSCMQTLKIFYNTKI